jgi:hypothetical protein
MKTRILCLGMFVFCSFNIARAAAPVITSVAPAKAVPGASVIITGLNFSSTPASNIVFFGAVRANVLFAGPTNLVVTVPAGATYAPLTVAVNGLVAYSRNLFMPTFAGGGMAIGPATFGPRLDMATLNGPIHTAIGDLNGDGRPDLVLGNAYSHVISIFQNLSTNGLLTTSSFATRIDLPPIGGTSDNPYGLVAADVNGDGKLDLVVCDRGGNRILIYRNYSSGGTLTTNSFAAPLAFAVGADPRYVRVVDLDGDGRPDLVCGCTGANVVSILQNIGAPGSLTTASFATHVDLPAGAGARDMAVGDLDGDGRPDLAVVNADGPSVSIYRNLMTGPGTIGTGSFTTQVQLPAPAGPLTIASGDLDGDGKPDLVIGCWGGTCASVYRNLASPGSLSTSSFAARIDFGTAGVVHIVALGDLNGDAKPDIALVAEMNSNLSVFQNLSTPGSFTGSSLGSRVDYATGWNPWGVSVGDLDGDGRPDVVFGNCYDNMISIYQNATPFTNPPTCTPAPSDLISWWRGENNGLDSADGNNGTLLDGTTYAGGKVGQTFSSANTNGPGVLVPASANLNVGAGNGFTLEAWIKPADVSQRFPIFEWNIGNGTTQWGVHFHIDPFGFGAGPGTLYANVVDSFGGWRQIYAARVLTNGVFQHVALTYDKTTGMATIYRNGVIVRQQNLGIFTPQTTYDLYLGRRPLSPTAEQYSFVGALDEPAVYNRALSSNEIAAIYSAGSAGKCVDSLPPVIVTQPANQAVNAGGTATFTVTANGSSPLSYRWFFGSNGLAGATAPTLTLTNVQTAQAGVYRVVVSNLVGMVTSSNALLYVNRWPVADASATDPHVVVCNTSNAAVVLNGTRSFDPDGDPLQYFWSESGTPLGTGVVAVVTLPLGIHPIQLVVNDGMAAASNGVTVTVVTAAQAITELIAVIKDSDIKHKQPLIVSLEAASASIARCNPIPAEGQLGAFQNKVRAQIAPDDPVLARTLIDLAQEIINSLETCCGCENRRHGKIDAWHGNHGRVHLEFEGSTGRCYIVEASGDLVNWEKIGVATDLQDGNFEFEDNDSNGAPARFYRIVAP